MDAAALREGAARGSGVVPRLDWSSPAGRVKRLMDVVIGAGLLVGLAPLLVLIAALVRLTSPGPALHPWRVVGENGRRFTGWKFRTMVAGAEDLRPSLMDRNEMRGPVFKIRDDPRVTPLGRLLRRFSLDELPQLWSVLVGDMSLVGPRPPLVSEYERFTERQRLKLSVRPGITCLWQVGGRNEIADFDRWVDLDLEYIERWSLLLDVKILLRTVPAVLVGRGAR